MGEVMTLAILIVLVFGLDALIALAMWKGWL